MTMNGINDHGCCPEGFGEAIQLVDPAVPFLDEDYVKRCFSKHPEFCGPPPLEGPIADDEGDRLFICEE